MMVVVVMVYSGVLVVVVGIGAVRRCRGRAGWVAPGCSSTLTLTCQRLTKSPTPVARGYLWGWYLVWAKAGWMEVGAKESGLDWRAKTYGNDCVHYASSVDTRPIKPYLLGVAPVNGYSGEDAGCCCVV
ncbi:hypothetical protein B0T13DRAFT_218735 [Neurospora crassa]|nr:hypothetical protein B0T13DRAFT_218735 [Neurospora crassa]